MNLALIIFIVCTSANVIIGTIKSVMTIKGGKFAAAFWNAASYGLYSFIVVMTANAEISTFAKVAVTVICNLICVYGVKLVEEKMRKDRLWKYEITVLASQRNKVCEMLSSSGLSYNFIDNVGKHTIFNIFAETQEQSRKVNEIIKATGAKAFASETPLAP